MNNGRGCRFWMLGLVFSAVVCAQAADYTWQGGSGLFSDPGKWSPAGVPADGDTATFSTAAPGTVTWTESTVNAALIASAINGNTVVLDLAGYTHTLTNRFAFEGDKASSYLVVSNGTLAVATNTCDVKINAGVAPVQLTFADGAVAALFGLNTWRSDVTVAAGASLTCNGEVKIGDGTANSVSALNVNGGTLTLNNHVWMNGGNNSTSTLSITDGSVVAKKYFSIGNGGGGTGWGVLNLSGGYLEAWGDIWLGNASSTRGVANISGGLWVPKGNFEVAHGGYTVSWLNMTGGEILMPTSGKNMLVANSGNGHFTTGTVSLVGGTITATNNASISVGNSSNGLGRVCLGGTGYIHVRDFKLGTYRAARGECTVTGGLLRAENYIGVGSAAGSEGAMIVDGGEVSARQINVGDTAGGSGFFALSNGMVHTDAKLYVGCGGTGTFYIAGGTLLLSNDFSVGQGATTGTGTVFMTGGDVRTMTNLKVGDWGGPGSFELDDGVITCASSAVVGNGNGSTGMLWMKGGLLVCNNMTLGNSPNGHGTVVMDGGDIVVSNTLSAANNSMTDGHLAMTGGAVWANYVSVGASGTGEMTVSGGTLTAGTNLTVGANASGTGMVTITGGTIKVKNSVYAANSGKGVLTIEGGNVVISNLLSCGQNTGSTGTLTLAGGNVLAKGGDWGRSGPAEVTISGGTNTFFGADVLVGVYTSGVLTISGGSNAFVNLRVGRNSFSAAGTLTVTGGRSTVKDYLDIGQAGPATFAMAGGEMTTRILRMNPSTTTNPVPLQSEIRVSGGRLQVKEACYFPDTVSITGKLTLVGGVFAVPNLQQWNGKLHVLFDGGTVEAIKSDSSFIRTLDWWALTGNGLVVDSAGFAIGTSLVLPDADGEHGRLVKKGAGTFTLYAANTFTGPVVVEGGELTLGSSGLITLAGGCEIDGGALLNLSARNLDFTLPAGTISRIDGELRLASGKTLTVGGGATLSGTGTVGRVVLESGATLVRRADAGGALLHASELVIPAGAAINLVGYSAAELRQGVAVVTGDTLSVAPGGSVSVMLDGVASALPVALRVSGSTLTATSYDPGTLFRMQ